MIQDYSKLTTEDEAYCLLGIVINRGKAKKLTRFASRIGFTKANCLLAEGRSAATNRLLELLALDEGDMEVVLFGLKKRYEEEVLMQFNNEFHFDKPHKGIAFTIPLCYHQEMDKQYESETPYVMVFTILDEEKTDDFSHFIQKKGFLGITYIKARGAASITNPLMEMQVESAKSMIMTIIHRNRVDEFVNIVSNEYNLDSENTGIMIVLPLNKAIGLADTNDEQPIKQSEKFDIVKQLLVALVPHAHAEDYLHKMNSLGVSGSTIIHSRYMNFSPEAEGIFPFCADNEEEMVITLATHSLVKEIREHMHKVLIDKDIKKTYAVSLPVIRSKGVRGEHTNS